MTTNRDRSRYFSRFAFSRDGLSLNRRIHAIARHHAGLHASSIDPNWHSVNIQFDYADAQGFLDLNTSAKDECRLTFDYRPTLVELVGPKVGHVDLTASAFKVIPEPICMLMRTCGEIGGRYSMLAVHTLHNPEHAIELIDGKTVIVFENCAAGIVRNVRGDIFDIEDLRGLIPLHETQMHYTRQTLMRDLKVDGMCGQACDVDYRPFLPRND